MRKLEQMAAAIGAGVRAGRQRAGLSLKKLATDADVSERYLHRLEAGAANVSIGVLLRVAAALDLDIAELMAPPDSGPDVAARSRPLHPPLAALLERLSLREQIDAHANLERHVTARRRATKGLALVGLRGAGKSTLGRRLAELTGLHYVSITREIEERAGMSLDELFSLGGADAYRALENEVVAALVRDKRRFVVETAGGIVGNGQALDAILAAFHVVWLRATPEEHLARVAGQGDLRPMHGNPKALENIRALLRQREPAYARADRVLDTSGRSIDDCVAELAAAAADVLPRK